MTDQGRILRIAEAMGLNAYLRWDNVVAIRLPNGTDRKFDPRTNANDCEALIRHLRGAGVKVNVTFGEKQDHVIFSLEQPYFADHGFFDDWKQGVCELALKVIDHD